MVKARKHETQAKRQTRSSTVGSTQKRKRSVSGTTQHTRHSNRDQNETSTSQQHRRRSSGTQNKAPSTHQQCRRSSGAQNEAPASQQKRRRSRSGNENTPRKKHRGSGRKNSQSSDEDDSMRMYKVPAKQYSTWRPLQQTALDAVMQIVDSNIDQVLSVCSSRSYAEVQVHLAKLRKRLLRSFQWIKAPQSKFDIKTVQNLLAKVDGASEDALEQLSRLQREENRLECLTEAADEEEERLRDNLVVATARITQQEECEDEQEAHDVLQLPAVGSQYRSAGSTSKHLDFMKIQSKVVESGT